MTATQTGQVFFCPMHADVRHPAAGDCPKCGMALVPEGARFALLRHMMSRPFHLVAMVVVMLVLMAAAMLLLH